MDPSLLSEITLGVVPGDSEDVVSRRTGIQEAVAGLSLQVIANLTLDFWSEAALAKFGSEAASKNDRLLFTSSGLAVSQDCSTYLSSVALTATRGQPRIQSLDLHGLVEALSKRVGGVIPSVLVPPLKALTKIKSNEYVELSELRFSDAQSRSNSKAIATTVTGQTVEIMVDELPSHPTRRGSVEPGFTAAGDAVLALLRWCVAVWLCNPDDKLMVYLAYVGRIASLAASSNWGIAIRADRLHRRAIPARLAADEGSLAELFSEDAVTRSFNAASLDFHRSQGFGFPDTPSSSTRRRNTAPKTGQPSAKIAKASTASSPPLASGGAPPKSESSARKNV
ncbi:hypothetical protein FOZ62_009251 [Perkinsus olseni]|uniref:Uncharacterized protein n=1 Tax=Perkinsus olseni TaxID=32597 RepID=A0A7J6SJ29_PEROL|nr:hypothetical protein FOZ62_009251 [Perkinsus olseni]